MIQRVSDTARGVRRLGFGVSGVHGAPILPAAATHKLVRRAFDVGVRYFDTAPSYGNGEAERRLGAALATLPRIECVISTKVGIYSAGPGRRMRDFSPDMVHRSIDASLKRLRIKKLDWLLLHGPAPIELTDALFKAVEEEQFNGRVGLLGVAGRGPEMEAALETGLFHVFMAPVHSALREGGLERLAKIRATGAELIGIETMTPSLPQYPAPMSIGKAWRLMRSLVRRPAHVPVSESSIEESLRWALGEGGAHRVMMTTAREKHLVQNARCVESAPEKA